jgi:integrase
VQLPLSEAALGFIRGWKERGARTDAGELVFATSTGKPISADNVLRRAIFPACEALGLPHATWLTFRRTYSSWSHDKGVPGKVVAQLMGHANVDTTLNVYTQVLDGALRAAFALRASARQPSRGLPTVAHAYVGKRERRLTRPAGLEPATSWFVAGTRSVSRRLRLVA